jgi:hypothetical protein
MFFVFMAGTSLVDVYAKEFSAYGTKEMFRQRVKAGLITVNGEGVRASADRRLARNRSQPF